ncbi:MAG: Lrp/AsnC family transcriptional regulator [Thermoplasmata archaeon]|nr:MAG: Lrp/AsnC family transcriptional regulator [Thermoplasmata archaeon]
MSNKASKSNKNIYNNEILHALLDDPTKSLRIIAKELKSYRQKIWREKRKLEEEHIIWGYTAVVDERKLNHVSYVMLLKMKPMTKELVDLMLLRLHGKEQEKQNVRLQDLWIVNGEYDWVLRFSAPDHPTARRYYETLRYLYDEYLLEKPVMIDLNFCLVSEGKINPELEKLRDFVP